MRLTPSTVLAGAALFFALGGSAVAVTEAVRPQARCQAGAVRGFIAVNGDPTKGIANIGDAFTSARPMVGVRFNCAGPAPQARSAPLTRSVTCSEYSTFDSAPKKTQNRSLKPRASRTLTISSTLLSLKNQK